MVCLYCVGEKKSDDALFLVPVLSIYDKHYKYFSSLTYQPWQFQVINFIFYHNL